MVDYNPDMRFYLSDMLILLGYTGNSFDNATAFLEQSMDISPAVVLLDMRMPGLNGLELHAKLDALGRKTPIVFISGESNKDEIIEAFRLGAVGFLLKPFNREKLCQVVDKALDMDRQRNQEFINTDALRRSFPSLSTREQEIFVLIVQGRQETPVHHLPKVRNQHERRTHQPVQGCRIEQTHASANLDGAMIGQG